MKFRQVLHKKSPALRKIAHLNNRDGYYYHGDNQKRKIESWRQVGDEVIIEGVVINAL